MKAEDFHRIVHIVRGWEDGRREDKEAGFVYDNELTLFFDGQSVKCLPKDFLDYNDDWLSEEIPDKTDVGFNTGRNIFVCDLDKVSAIMLNEKEHES